VSIQELASYRHCTERITTAWAGFLNLRSDRLEQQRRYGHASEKVAENIIEDLLTQVLDWTVADLNNQVDYADLLMTRLGVKHLLVETKRPGALAWNSHAVHAALEQACRYADEQHVRTVAVSDGVMLYAADRLHGALEDRVFVNLEAPDPPLCLWWLSVHGIYRSRLEAGDAHLRLLPEPPPPQDSTLRVETDALLHPKYRLPAYCFAYVGHETQPQTWKLPYRVLDGHPDAARLPKAIQCIITNYRGAKVGGIPEAAIPDVLVRLARAATELGKMPNQNPETAPAYAQLAAVLEQVGRLAEVTGE
jgi:hypothetical protein